VVGDDLGQKLSCGRGGGNLLQRLVQGHRFSPD
jgi:hypothetical protein